MPRPDGTLYNYEKPGNIKPEKPAKVKPVKAIVVKPKRAPHPLRPVPGKAGRPMTIKATPELVDAACADIRKGLPVESALVLRGISMAGMDKWRKMNPAVDMEFRKAESDFEMRMVSRIETASQRDPKCAQWLLERRTAARWAQTLKSELTGKNGQPFQSMTVSKQLFASVAKDVDRAKNVTPTPKPRAIDV